LPERKEHAFRGDRLEGIREFKKLGRSDLANLTGIDPAGIQRLETGAIKNPRSDRVEVLAQKLDVTNDYLMGIGPDRPYAEAAVLQALERFKRTEGGKFAPLDEQALAKAAEYEDAFHTVAHWRAFVAMSSLAWGKSPRMLKVSAEAMKGPAAKQPGEVRRFDAGGRKRGV